MKGKYTRNLVLFLVIGGTLINYYSWVQVKEFFTIHLALLMITLGIYFTFNHLYDIMVKLKK